MMEFLVVVAVENAGRVSPREREKGGGMCQ